MENPAAKESFDNALEQAEKLNDQVEELGRKVDGWLEIAELIGDQYGFELPELVHRRRGGDVTQLPWGAPLEEQIVYMLEHQFDGPTSISGIYFVWRKLAEMNNREIFSERRFRHAFKKLESSRRIIKASGPKQKPMTWRLISMAEREATEPKNNGRPTMTERVLEAFRQRGSVGQPGEIDSIIRQDDPDLKEGFAVAQTMARLAGEGRLWRKKYGSRVYTYGLMDWAEDGTDDERGFKPEFLTDELRRSQDSLFGTV